MSAPLDLHTPLPDPAHDALRLAVLAALEQLDTQVQRINDAYLLLLATAGFAQGTLNTTLAGTERMNELGTAADGQRKQHDALAARVKTIEDKLLTLNLGIRL